jgi:hypothetical protein
MKKLKHLKTFESYQEEPVNEAVLEILTICSGLVYVFLILKAAQGLATVSYRLHKLESEDDENEEEKDDIDNPDNGKRTSIFSKVVNRIKSYTQKTLDIMKGVISDIKSLGLENDAEEWLNTNFVNNPDFKIMDDQISKIQAEISDIEERKSKSTSEIKIRQLDTFLVNKNKQISDITNNRTMKGKSLFDKLQEENLPLYKALSRVWEKMAIDEIITT